MVKTNKVILNGGGGYPQNLQNASIASNKSKFFRPIVASSLALFLSAGIASATQTCNSSTTDPSICYTIGSGTETTFTSGPTWEASTSSGANVVTPKSGSNALTELRFEFNKPGSSSPSGSLTGTTYTITSGTTSDLQIFTLDGGTKSIEINNGSGKLALDFGVDSNIKRQFHLNLSKAQGNDFSFKGNIEITAGEGSGINENTNSKFMGKFGKDIKGSITINNITEPSGNTPSDKMQKGHKTELLFLNTAGLEGALTTKAGTTTAIFTNGSITGNVSATNGNGAYTGATNSITFKGNDNKIEGNVSVSDGGVNNITFEQNGTIKGSINGTKGINNITANTNKLTIGDAAATPPNIYKIGGAPTDKLTNLIKAKELDINVNAILMEAKTDVKSKNEITASNKAKIKTVDIKAKYGHNIISASDLTLEASGKIFSNGTSSNIGITQNIIKANKGTITVNELEARSSINTFMLNSGSITINDATIANGGRNLLTFTGTGSTITGNGNITATGSGRNTFEAENIAIKTKGSNTVTILASSNSSTNSIGAKKLEIDAKSIKAISGGTNNFTAAEGTDTLIKAKLIYTDDGANVFTLQNGGKIEAESIESSLGSNAFYLGKQAQIKTELISTTGGSNIAYLEDAAVTAGMVEASNGADANNIFTLHDSRLTINSFLVADHEGRNTINLNNSEFIIKGGIEATNDGINIINIEKGSRAALKIEGDINTNGGTNSIILDNAVLRLDIKNSSSLNNGNNQITLKGESKLFNTSTKLALENLIFENTKFFSQDLFYEPLVQRNAIVDFTLEHKNDKEFRLLTIGDTGGNNKGLRGENGLFRIYVDNSTSTNNTLGGVEAKQATDTFGYAYSDRVIVHSVLDREGRTTQTPLTEHLQVITSPEVPLGSIAYYGGGTEIEGNIAVFTTKNDAEGNALVNLQAQHSILGYDAIATELVSVKTHENGKVNDNSAGSPYTGSNADYTTYFIKSMDQIGASIANQKSAAAALGANYELYLANLNSLNKRMGELRENANTHGVWARVFNGMQSTDFNSALNTRSIYTTIQGGYDYSFGFNGASNILGFALSYANSMGSSSKSEDYNGVFKGLRNANSNAVEFAIYNAYIQDGASSATGWKNGLYTDSILKFSYIMSSLNFLDQGSATYNTSNIAFSFSQELGYRFLLGDNKEFFIDPQAEITLGFLNQSNLKQKLGGHFMDSIQDAILTLRNRVGSNFGYKFDQFTQNKGFNASLYLGTYFVSDFITGGDISITTDSKKSVSFKPLASTARFVLNLGANFKIKDNIRIYFDFERSFGGAITTDYQFNLGVRYGFGTSAYTPYSQTSTQETKDASTLKEVAPAKGFYIELLEKEENKLSNKEKKVLEKLKDNLRVQTKIQGNKTTKTYLVGPFKDEAKAKENKAELEGTIKELKAKGNILEVE